MKVISRILVGLIAFFVLTFIVYYFHLDDKLIRKLYVIMGERFDEMERDVRI